MCWDMTRLGKPRGPGREYSHLNHSEPVHKTGGQYFTSHLTDEELCQTQQTASQWVIRQVLAQWKQPRRRCFFCSLLGFIFIVRQSALGQE